MRSWLQECVLYSFIKIPPNEVREDLRLEYRFLDLRSQKLKKNLQLRARLLQFLRLQMIEQGFLEVQTRNLECLGRQVLLGRGLCQQNPLVLQFFQHCYAIIFYLNR